MSLTARDKLLSVVGVAAAGMLAVFVNVLAARHYKRWDATQSRLYSLSQPTNYTLDSIEHDERDVELFVFIGAGDPLLGSIKQILTTYQARAPKHLHVRYLDPDRNRAEFMRLQTELQVNAKAEEGRITADAQIVARHGQRVWYVKTDDMVVFDESNDAKVRPRVESAITSAIRAVLTTDTPRVCFTAGHKEASVADPTEKGISTLKSKLTHDNFSVVTVDLTTENASLAGCVMVAIVAPTDPFLTAEIAKVDAAVKGGAAMLLVVPPEIDRETLNLRPTGLGEIAALGGVSLDDAVAVEQEPALREPGQLGLIFSARVHSHATTDELRHFAEANGGEAAVPLLYARPLLRLSLPGVPAQEMLVTSDQSFALHDIATFIASKEEPKKSASDRVGPLDLAVAVVRDKSIGGSRVVVVGTSTPFVNAAYLDPSPQMVLTRTLGLLWVSWLTARPPILDLPPKASVQIALHLSEDDVSSIRNYVLIYMPIAVALIGGAVWARRRSTEGKRPRGRREVPTE